MSFNPRTHEGCDLANRVLDLRMDVSIHAPTRGATLQKFQQHQHQHVSIHAPTRGATLLTLKDVENYEFQSTHPRGVRPSL